jgi:FlaA1/EpsC-like NDP-sugar epimerase
MGSVRLPAVPESDGTQHETHESYPRRNWPGRIVTFLQRDVPLVLLDLAIVFVSYLALLVIRFDGEVPPRYWGTYWAFVPVAGCLHLLMNYMFGLYGQMWRYASVQEARRVLLAGASSAGLVLIFGSLLWKGIRPLPLSVVGMAAVVSLIGFGAIRFQSRLFAFRRRSVLDDVRRTVVVGAGDAGAALLRDIRRSPALGLQPVAVVDDDPRKLNRRLFGVMVSGRIADLPRLAEEQHADQVVLAIPSATSQLVRDVAARCEEAHVTLRVLPSVREAMNGHVTARDVRDLQIEDLLGRQQVKIDLESVASILTGRRILVTGAGGSIGSEIARQVLQFAPDTLTLMDHDETHLHDLLTELAGADNVEISLTDVRDRDRVFGLFATARPEVVFHAAAHKHVPLLESHPDEAVRTNVLGTANVADASAANSVERFVLISTDKAIKPISVMGASKWFAEQIVSSFDQSSCVFCSVRFGNVLGSRGSVIPTFLRQIAHGGPVTVTDPSMTRYFMSVQEAVQLVLQAASMSTGGEVFTLNMGEPVRILDVACELIRLSGRVPYKDIDIEIIGPRPGEKVKEDVVNPDEVLLPSAHPAVTVSRTTTPDLGALRRALNELETHADAHQSNGLAALIKGLAWPPMRIPEDIRL